MVRELETSGRAFVFGAINVFCNTLMKPSKKHNDESSSRAIRQASAAKILILKFLNLGFNPPSLNTLVRPGHVELRQAGSLCYITPSRRHSGCRAIAAGMALRDRSTVRKTM